MVSEEECSYNDNLIGQSKRVKQRATAIGQRKEAPANTTRNEQHKRSMALLKEKEASLKEKEDVIKKLESKLIDNGKLTIGPKFELVDNLTNEEYDIDEDLQDKSYCIQRLEFLENGPYVKK